MDFYGGKHRYKWMEMLPVWEKYIDSYLGGVNYKKKRYLLQGATESDDKFLLRVRASGYTNFCKPIVNGYTKHIYKLPIERIGLDKINLFINWDNKQVDHFWRECTNLLATYGEIYLYIEWPDVDEDVSYADLTADKRYTVHIVPPQNVPYYTADEAIILRDNYENGMLKQIPIFITADKIACQGDERPNPFGRIPLFKLIIDQNKDGIGESLISDISDLNNMIYNLMSSAYAESINSAFSSLMLPWTQEIQRIYDKQFPTEMGRDGVERPTYTPREIMLYPAGHEFSYLNKDISGIQFKMALIEQIKNDIQTMGNQKMQEMLMNQSGVAKAYDFMTFASQLSALSRVLESFEYQIFQFFVDYIKPNYVKWDINYPDSFDIVAEDKQMTALKELVELPVGAYCTTKALVEIARNTINLDDKEIEIVREEISEKLKTPPVPPPADLGEGANEEESTEEVEESTEDVKDDE